MTRATKVRMEACSEGVRRAFQACQAILELSSELVCRVGNSGLPDSEPVRAVHLCGR